MYQSHESYEHNLLHVACWNPIDLPIYRGIGWVSCLSGQDHTIPFQIRLYDWLLNLQPQTSSNNWLNETLPPTTETCFNHVHHPPPPPPHHHHHHHPLLQHGTSTNLLPGAKSLLTPSERWQTMLTLHPNPASDDERAWQCTRPASPSQPCSALHTTLIATVQASSVQPNQLRER